MYTITVVRTKKKIQNSIFSLLCIGFVVEGGTENEVGRVVRVELLQCI
jgi:hypothetical protein